MSIKNFSEENRECEGQRMRIHFMQAQNSTRLFWFLPVIGLPKAKSSVYLQQKIICTTVGIFSNVFSLSFTLAARKYFSNVR